MSVTRAMKKYEFAHFNSEDWDWRRDLVGKHGGASSSGPKGFFDGIKLEWFKLGECQCGKLERWEERKRTDSFEHNAERRMPASTPLLIKSEDCFYTSQYKTYYVEDAVKDEDNGIWTYFAKPANKNFRPMMIKPYTDKMYNLIIDQQGMTKKMLSVRLTDLVHQKDVTAKPYVLHADRYIGEVVDHVRYELGIGPHVKVSLVHDFKKVNERNTINTLGGVAKKTISKRPAQSFKTTVKKRCVVEDSIGVFATTDG